jgi:hypothetical protein
MSTVRQVARIISTKGTLPDTYRDLGNSAHLLHAEVLREARRTGTPDGDGYRWQGNIKTIMRSLWRGIPPGTTRDKDANKAQEILFRYLHDTGNMRKIARPSLWWVRAEWNNKPPAGMDEASRHKEARVTGHEAGDDREPGDVITSWQCPYCDHPPFASKVRRSAHVFTFEKHESLDEWLIKALTELPGVPAGPSEVFAYIEPLGFLGSISLVTNGLRDAARSRRSPITLALVEGRERITYALSSRLDEMKTRRDFAPVCREPGCGCGPFIGTDGRKTHELRAHPDSPNRHWVCTEGDWNGYDVAALRMHIIRAHAPSPEEMATMVEIASEEAAKRKDVPVAEPWGSKPEIGMMPVVTAPALMPPAPVPTPAIRERHLADLAASPAVPVDDDDDDDVEAFLATLVKTVTQITVWAQKMRADNRQLRADNDQLSRHQANFSHLQRLLDQLKDVE